MNRRPKGPWPAVDVEFSSFRQRLNPISQGFFSSLARPDGERPPEAATERVLVVLKGRRRGNRCRLLA